MTADPRTVDVLVVGAGPTGLMLAAALRRGGARVRLVDRQPAGPRESRALVVHSRTMELFRQLGIDGALAERGNAGGRIQLRAHGRVAGQLDIDDLGLDDTAFPTVLFVSQAETEAVLAEHLAAAGVAIERHVELTAFAEEPDGVRCRLRRAGGRQEEVLAAYVAGCDGAHSTVRHLLAMPFEGAPYPEEFLLGDVEVDARDGVDLPPDALQLMLGSQGLLAAFPLRAPRPWRILAATGQAPAGAAHGSVPATLEDLQAATDTFEPRLRLRDPAWLARFRFHHRQATSYRAGRAFLAGDAAHIHSPAGGQGMNTGIQDAWNLGWKLALVTAGRAPAELLDSYHAERWPVGHDLLAFTDRLFSAGSSTRPLARVVRTEIVPRAVPLLLRFRGLRPLAYRRMSQLDVGYRGTPAVEEGSPAPHGGPRPGDRLPDARVLDGDRQTWLHDGLRTPWFALLLTGPAGGWDDAALAGLGAARGDLLCTRRLGRTPAAGALTDPRGTALAALGVGDGQTAQYLVRPDGHVAYRAAGADLAGLRRYLDRWLPAAS